LGLELFWRISFTESGMAGDHEPFDITARRLGDAFWGFCIGVVCAVIFGSMWLLSI
jgi:hypothetical protein